MHYFILYCEMIYPLDMKTQSDIFTNRKKLFWIFHISFWLISWLTNYFALLSSTNDSKSYLWGSIYIAAGFLLSLAMHYFLYQKFEFHKFPLRTLLPLIFIYSSLVAILRDYSAAFSIYFLYGSHFMFKNPMAYVLNLWPQTRIQLYWSALYFALKIYEELVIQKQETQQARLLAKTAQFEALRYQLNPHFFFNTLSSLRYLIRRDIKKAEEMITMISEFMRYSLLSGSKHEVSLSQEIQILKHYLDIEKVRFGENLVVEYDIPQQIEDYPVPALLIHPLVENAIKHGMQSSPKPLLIRIKGESNNGKLILSVFNTGKWIDASQKIETDGTNTGLQNVKQRLEHFYLGKNSFEIIKGTDSVEVRLGLER
jgi:two-component system, LytTR family, sensor kinase